MKKDIFNGKVKKEYLSYILGYIIFFLSLLVVGGALCIYAFVSEGSFNVSGNRFLIAIFGVVAFVLGSVYSFPALFVIRKFPKLPKLRRIFFNSDIYFTDSTTNEYFGGTRMFRGRRRKAAFDIVTSFAEAEKQMGEKKPIKYKIYLVLVIVMSVLGILLLFAMPLLFENGIILPEVSDDIFLVCWISGCCVCIGLAIFFLVRAFKVAKMAQLDNDKRE